MAVAKFICKTEETLLSDNIDNDIFHELYGQLTEKGTRYMHFKLKN